MKSAARSYAIALYMRVYLNILCGDGVLPMLAFAAHAVIPGLALGSWCDVASSYDEVTEVLAFVSLERVTLNHRLQDRENLRLRYGFWLDHLSIPLQGVRAMKVSPR